MGRPVSMNPATFGDYPISRAEREAEAAMHKANLKAAATAAQRKIRASTRNASRHPSFATASARRRASTVNGGGGGNSRSGDDDGESDPDPADLSVPPVDPDPSDFDPDRELLAVCREFVDRLLARIDAEIAAGVPRWSQRMGVSS